LRGRLSAARDSEPGRWDAPRAGLGTVVGVAGSSFLAGLAGVAEITNLRFSSIQDGQFLTFAALAAVLLGGASVFGRRAGVAGTVLGVLIVVTGQVLIIVHDGAFWMTDALVGAAIVLGLGVSRLLESVGSALGT
jgi:ribose/xylose/arabinose/galactoside ABC-type transport system permease subunit